MNKQERDCMDPRFYSGDQSKKDVNPQTPKNNETH